MPRADRPVTMTRGAEVVGSGCALENALNAELDADCQVLDNNSIKYKIYLTMMMMP